MIHILRIIIVLVIFIITNSRLTAQEHTDSLRAVAEALKMIQFPEPQFNAPFSFEITQKGMEDMGFDQPYISEVITLKMRDSVLIHGQNYTHDSNKTILLLHGTLATSFTYNKMSGLLREAVQANVIAVDLRGHGQSGGIPGDVSTLNQYAEDLDDMISAIKKQRPNDTIILAGHSMGGGIVLRHAETFPKTKVDAYLLFAPNLGNNAPTTSQVLNLKSNFIKTHLSRGLGLKMLNEFGIHTYDSMHVVFYNLPEQMPIKSYSYRSMQASFPEDYKKTLQSISKPVLVLVGSNDEAFIAKEYAVVINSYSKGDYYMVEGETHNGIRHNAEAMTKIKNWVNNTKFNNQ
ncbi:alpha/beta fold hydrolase [Winogradskyella sp.]|uniref:alpha/beta hydrolase n=1 Tax=Winogradskyella sp. TaxID=1883156 RepID=UPI0025D654AF|nr:alpha/beta fold hydrolase [Winogradskyella sp.]